MTTAFLAAWCGLSVVLGLLIGRVIHLADCGPTEEPHV
jgi:hypothetical protein